uniref:Fibronectin type III domain-containing protein 7-like n=1 Tax=Mastacembelus armatus TaxID=205130 RepID=A0A3Q3M673_9TELE
MMDPIQTVQPKDSRTLTAEFLLQTGATNYIIRVQNTNGFFREDTVSSSPAEIKSLTPYTEYMLSIMAVNSGGHSQPTLPVTARTVLPPPQISTSSPSNDSIIVSWAPVPHAVQYSLSINKFGSNTSMTFNTSNTNLTISGLDAGSLYVISGFAWDMEGRKGESHTTADRHTIAPVNEINAVAGLSVSWKLNQEVYGSIQYSVMSNQNLTCNATSSSCTLSPVNCGEVHIIQVTASNKAGEISAPVLSVPCPPESLAVVESTDGNCTLTWNTVPYADSYLAIIKRGNFGDSGGETCNTTSSSCTFYCQCGYTYLMSVLAFNQAGSSPQGKTVNYTTLPCCPEGVSVSVVSTDTLEITWTASRGADLYETRAADSSEVIRCNDTAPVCALSDLDCDSPYSVVSTFKSFVSHPSAPCMPTSLVLNLRNSTSVSVSWAANNRAALYTVSARGDDGMRTCTSPGNSCVITGLLCGSTYEISVIANNTAGQSLPSYSDLLETEPCCPVNLTVDQVTQAVTNVSWSITRGARSFITSLTSPRGNARCHTRDSSCLMGCITCGTNYTIAMEAISLSGRRSNCTYQGFSSSACCPSGVRLYRMAGNSLRVYWRSSGSHSYTVEMVGSSKNYTCTAAHGDNSCDVGNVQCGDVYHVVVAPLTPEGKKVLFCPRRLYSVIYRGKRSVD